MNMQQTIETKIKDAVAPTHLEVINETHMHNVPPDSESHFKLVIVADAFEGISRVQRHQKINGVLAQELKGTVHALSMQTLTTKEWAERNGAIIASPACMGGSKADRMPSD